MWTFPSDMIKYINMFLLVWFLVELYRGYKRGFLLQLVDFSGTVVALFGAWLFSEPLARVIKIMPVKGNGYASIEQMVNLQINRLIWVLIIFVILKLALLLVRPLASFISKLPLIKQVNSSVGGVTSVIVFGFKLVILIFFLSFPIVKNGSEIVEGSALQYVSKYSVSIFESAQEVIDKNTAIQNLIAHKALTPEQSDAMVEWLISKGFTTSDIQEYLNNNE